jgi:hypothetical protein
MVATVHHFRLASGAGSLGPSWGETGLALAGVSLFRHTDEGFAPRPVDELEALLKAAYERDLDASTVRGLGVAAAALNEGDIGRAMIAALHLRLPDLSWEAASRLAKVDERLAKYNADQPRDWHGRWTSEGSGGAAEYEANPTDTQPAPLRSEVGAHDAESEGEAEPGEGDNNPPFGRPPGPIVDPILGAPPKVPEGWDRPPEMVDGHYVPAVRFPTLPGGTPWPQPTIHLVQTILASRPGKKPVLQLFVPRDGKGPTLLGSDLKGDYPQPPGYDLVKLIGTPQITNSRGVETGHARDSVEVALDLAASNRFSEIYFNSSISTVTEGAREEAFRPDIVAVVRPELSAEPTFKPYEIYSPGQKPAVRELQLNGIPGFIQLEGHSYKYLFENGILMLQHIGPLL